MAADEGPAARTRSATRDDIRMLRSTGFLVGLALMLVAFVLALPALDSVVPDGLVRDASVAYRSLALRAPATFVFAIAGILAPPSAFFGGAILGFLNAALVAVLALATQDLAASAAGLERVAPLFAVSIVAGAAITGGIAWVVRRVRGEPPAGVGREAAGGANGRGRPRGSQG